MAQRGPHRELGLDLWLALLAGDRAWRDGSGQPTPREQVVGAILVVALLGTVMTQWVALASRVSLTDAVSGTDIALLAAAATSTGAAVGLAAWPLGLARGREVTYVPFGWSVAWRAAAYLVLLACSAAFLVRFRFLSAVPLGIVAGADILLTLGAIGSVPRPARWMRRFVFSTVHFGALGALLATAALEPARGGTLLSLYSAMWLGISVAVASIVLIDRLVGTIDAQREAERDTIRAQERSYRAHWLHDDVLSEVRVATLRMADGPATDGARRELLELDHRLRLRQLDEMLRGGTAHIYEVLQPHLRRAQSLGVILRRVPSLEATGRVVDELTARRINRVVSVITSNAINAGAASISIELEPLDGDLMRFAVADDAGGFDPATLPPGRGLDTLRRELGGDAVRVGSIPGGSVVSAIFEAPAVRVAAGRAGGEHRALGGAA
jgi:hypothetical protein